MLTTPPRASGMVGGKDGDQERQSPRPRGLQEGDAERHVLGRATATRRSGGLRYAPTRPPITSALDALIPKRSALSIGAPPAHPLSEPPGFLSPGLFVLRCRGVFDLHHRDQALYPRRVHSHILRDLVRGQDRTPPLLDLLFEADLSLVVQGSLLCPTLLNTPLIYPKR